MGYFPSPIFRTVLNEGGVIFIFVDHECSCFSVGPRQHALLCMLFRWKCCILSQNIHTAFLAALLAFAWFVTAKYFQTKYSASLVAGRNLYPPPPRPSTLRSTGASLLGICSSMSSTSFITLWLLGICRPDRRVPPILGICIVRVVLAHFGPMPDI